MALPTRLQGPAPWAAAVLVLLACVPLLKRGGEAKAGASSPSPIELDAPPGARASQLGGRPSANPPSGSLPAASGEATETQDTPTIPRLQRRVATIIANAVRKARDKSGGEVNSSEVVVAVHVQELGSDRDLVAIQSRSALRPASNMKLLTAAASMVLLGHDFHFETRFEAHGERRGRVLAGDLVARAGGDPLFIEESDGRLTPWLDGLAEDLLAAGIQRVEGDLVLDEGDFLEPGPGPAWPGKGEHWKEYAALCGGFSANAGCVTATLSPGAVGQAAKVRIGPTYYGLPPKLKVTTGKARSKLNVAVEARSHGLVVRGKFPADVREWSTRFAHPDPVDLFGAAVFGGLAQRGIQIDGNVVRRRGVAAGESVASLRSPLCDCLPPILRDSNNSVSDQVFLTLGAEQSGAGTRAGGAAAVRTALERLGVSAEGLIMVDGSGLSREDRVRPRQLTALIRAVLTRGGEASEHFRRALPVAGQSGTLKKRMRNSAAEGRVFAKTGFIGGTSGLSGLCETVDGRTLVFSILVAYPLVDGLNTSVWKPMQDEICEALVTSSPGNGE